MQPLALLFFILFFACGYSEASTKYQGSLVDGVELSSLQQGGATLSVLLQNGRFSTNLANDELINALAGGFQATAVPSFSTIMKGSLATGFVTVASSGKQLKIRLGPLPNFTVTEDTAFSIKLPQDLIQGEEVPPEIHSTIFVGTAASAFVSTNRPVMGSPMTVIFSGAMAEEVTFAQGTTCRAEPARVNIVTLEGNSVTFIPLRGGALSFCLHQKDKYFQIKGSALVAGAEGISTDPSIPRSNKQFYVNIFGSELTEQDSVALTRHSCLAKVDGSDFEFFEFEYSSQTRGGFFATVREAGDFHVCFQRAGGSFVDIGLITVEKGGDAVIDGDTHALVVEQDTLVLKSARIDRLTILGGSLLLDHFHLNVSQFEWLGGTIYGPGIITVMGEKSVISTPQPVLIDFTLRNIGHLEIRLGSVSLSGSGSISNYHRLTVDATGVAEGGARMLGGTQDHHVFRNLVSGTVAFRGPMDDTPIEIKSFFHNNGRVTVLEGSIIFSSLINSKGSLLEANPTTAMVIKAGWIQGEIDLNFASKLVVSTSKGKSVEFASTLFRLSDSTLVKMQNGEISLTSTRFEGNGAVAFGGNEPSINLVLEGTSVFAFGTAVGFSHSHLVSPRGCILSFYGNVALNLESTTVGDNVVIQSRLAAIMFAKGQDRTKLLPQNIPQNTSIVIPANTTLVIVDTGNRTQEELLAMQATPVVCSYYVVVPMYVAADGDILLRGCAMLPFGGTLNGIVYGSTTDVLLEASIKTAFCKTALLGGDGCLAASKSGWHSGLVLSGSFRADSESESRFDVGFLGISNGSLTVSKQLILHSPLLHVDTGSTLLLESGGLLAVDSFVLRGLLHTQSDLAIQGQLDARGGSFKLPPASGCYFPVSVDGEALYENSLVQCTNPPLTPTTGALIKSDSFVGEPMVDQRSCAANSMVAKAVLDQQSGLTLRVTEVAFQTTMTSRATLMLWAIMVVALTAWFMGFETPGELFKPPPMTIDLLWTEFSMFLPNLVVSAGVILEVCVLCAPAFLHSVPNTFILSWFSRMASSVIEPRESVSAAPLSVLCAFVIFVWAFAWLPLCGHNFRQQIQQFIDDYRGPSQRRSTRMLFQLHTAAVILAAPAYVPVLSILVETVACNTLYSTAHSCQHMKVLYWPFLLAAALLICLAPFSGVNKNFPFNHPPYQRDLDIRFKRSYVYTRYILLTLLVLGWKIAGTDMLQLITGSLLLQLILFCITVRSHPTGYKNINNAFAVGLLYPVWAHICALFSELHSTQSAVCPDTDYLFVIMVVAGWLLISIAIIYGLGNDANTSFADDLDIGNQLRMIVEGSQRIEECRNDMYNAANEREREAISHNLSALKLRHLHQLTLFRHRKESLLLMYYLGEEAGRTHYNSADSMSALSEDSNSFVQVTKAPIAVEPETMPLTIDLMDSYVRGPQLGSGSYGAVYMGMLSATGRLVAVKEVRVSSKKKDALSQVKKEVDFLKSLSHPNIVQYFGCRNKGGMMYVFMEFATGGSLTSLVRKFGRLQEPVVGMYAQQILTGLAYLHSRGIVHRDIKGDNILIDSCGVAKLADFGCSKMLADMANTSEEGCGTLIGSPYWMAPEVIRSEAYGTKADIWSIGCTVVEMLNGGEPAWREKFETAYAAMYFIGHSTEQYPTNIPECVSDRCRDFLARCFERDVSKRADAAELLNHPWLKEAQSSPLGAPDHHFSASPASVSMESVGRSESPTADASFEREMSSFA